MASWTIVFVVVIFALVDLSTAKPYGTPNEQVDNENHNEYQMMNDQGRPDQKLREFERDQGQLYHELSQLELQLDSLTRQQNDHIQPAYSAWQDDPKEEEQQQDEEELGDPEMEKEADDSEMEEVANYIGLEEAEDEGSGEEEEIEEKCKRLRKLIWIITKKIRAKWEEIIRLKNIRRILVRKIRKLKGRRG